MIDHCLKKCCKFNIDPDFKFGTHIHNLKKAGVILYDQKNNSVVLVMSKNNLWGFPKGSLQNAETYTTGAVRELKEETGIVLTSNEIKMLRGPHIIKETNWYYLLHFPKKNVSIQYTKENDDANGIGWFNLNCIKDLCIYNKIKLNYHTRKLLTKLFNVYIPYSKKKLIKKIL